MQSVSCMYVQVINLSAFDELSNAEMIWSTLLSCSVPYLWNILSLHYDILNKILLHWCCSRSSQF